MIGKLWKELTYFKKKDYLPKVPHDFYVPFDDKSLSDDERIILSAARSRDVVGAHKYLARKGENSAYDVLDLIQSKPVANKRQRLISWLMRCLGESPTDRVLSEYFRMEREKQKGQYTTHLE